MNIAKKALVFTSVIAIATGTSVSAKTRLSGAGASFPAKIYTRWFFDLAKSGGPRVNYQACLLYTSPSPRDRTRSRMPSSA